MDSFYYYLIGGGIIGFLLMMWGFSFDWRKQHKDPDYLKKIGYVEETLPIFGNGDDVIF